MNIDLAIACLGSALALGALAAASAAMGCVRRWRRRCESLEAGLAALRREIELITSISVRTGRRVQRVADDFSAVRERVDLFELRAAAGAASLHQAIDLARRGADKERLEKQFGLSHGEADLVARLHGRAVHQDCAAHSPDLSVTQRAGRRRSPADLRPLRGKSQHLVT